MKVSKIFAVIFFLLTIFQDCMAVSYELKRFDIDSKQLKIELEKSNKKNKQIKSVKNKKYEGIYKVGKPYSVLGRTYYPKEQPDYKEVGMASWYGSDFHNKKTANGETYNMNDYTAAHRTLPLPSMVRVTNLENGKSVKVRVNDRGPFAKGRIIDVSKKVAQKLDFHHQGTTKVRVEFLVEDTEAMLKEYGLK